MTTYVGYPGASGDDGTQNNSNGYVQLSSYDYLGVYTVLNAYHCGIRFLSATGVGGSTITSCQLRFYSTKVVSTAFVSNLYASKEASPAAFATGYNYGITNFPATTAYAPIGSTEVGNWAKNTAYYYTSAAVPAFLTVIQEVATAYPALDKIRLHIIYGSGSGYRQFHSYDTGADSSVWPQLTIDYTAFGPQTVTPAALSVRPKFPAIVGEPGPTTIVATAFSRAPVFPAVTVQLTTTVAVSAFYIGNIRFPTPTVVKGTPIIAVAALTVNTTIPIPLLGQYVALTTLRVIPVFRPVAVTAAEIIEVLALSVGPVFPLPGAATTTTVSVSTLHVVPAFPTTTVVVGTATLSVTTLSVTPALPSVTITTTVTVTASALGVGSPGFVLVTITTSTTIAVSAFSRSAYFPEPTIPGAGGVKWEYLGTVAWYIDTTDYPATVQFQLVAWIATSSALIPVQARLMDVDHNVEISGSLAEGTKLIPAPGEILLPTMSSLFTISTTANYAVQFGGQVGGSFVAYGAALNWES